MNICLFASLSWKNGGVLLLVDWGRLWRSHWEDGFPCPLPLLWGRKWPLEPLKFGVPLLEENDWLLFWGADPIGTFPVGASFLVGTTKGLIQVGSETLSLLRCLFWEGSLHRPWLIETWTVKAAKRMHSWVPDVSSPKCGCNRVISASHLSKPVLPMEYNSLWSISARDLLRQVKALCWIRSVLFQRSRYSQASLYPRFAAFSGSAPFLIWDLTFLKVDFKLCWHFSRVETWLDLNRSPGKGGSKVKCGDILSRLVFQFFENW